MGNIFLDLENFERISHGLTVLKEMNISYASQVAELISQENKEKKHMIEKSAQKILDDSNKHGFIGVANHISGELIGYFGLTGGSEKMNNKKIYERGSLIVKPSFRGRGLGRILRTSLLKTHKEKAIYSVTNIPRVIENNTMIEEFIITQKKLNKDLKTIIEKEGPLLDNDVIFINPTLNDLIKRNQ